MSQNDIIHLDAHFKNWQTGRGQNLKSIDPFVYYCAEQLLKPFDLSDEEISAGITDGSNDGGIDAIYFLVNRELVRDDTDVDSKTAQTVNLIVMQIKNTNGGFQPTEIDKIDLATKDILDLAIPTRELTSKYNPQLLDIIDTFKTKYSDIAGAFPDVSIEYFYVTKGDEVEPNPNAKQSGDRIRKTVRSYLSKADCTFHYVNAQRLLDRVQQRPPATRELAWSDMVQTDEGYIGLVRLANFYKFLQDENGYLARRIFESNVRGYMQDTTVNTQIQDSLQSAQTINFWLLNNGITILATSAGTAGPKRLNLRDPQIVNGLQTSREIYSYFHDNNPKGEERSVLVRVIETSNDAVSDAVIKATNSQNKMPPASLRATDAIHRQIEELFKHHELFYDRRKGVHRDEGRPVVRIVSVLELLQAVISAVLQRPDDARARPGDYLRDEDRYKEVFGADYPLPLYLACIRLLRRVEDFLADVPFERGDRRNIKFYVLYLLVCELTRSASPSHQAIEKIDASRISDDLLQQLSNRVWTKYTNLGHNDSVAKGADLLKALRSRVKAKYRRKR